MKLVDRIIQIADKLVTLLMTVCFLSVLCYGTYVLWDSQQIHQQADAGRYETYRPEADQTVSFSQLQSQNPEVFGWLTVIDTHIDYPLVQGENNSKYVNTDVAGNFSLSGSIFLDCRNQKDFSDLNHILYGHHMAKDAMFGELEYYKEPGYFKDHLEGALYYANTWHKVEFFAFLAADAYDSMLYNTALQNKERKAYLDYIKEHAVLYQELDFQGEEKFLVLSTCASTSTNGRYLLIGRITEDTQNRQGEP